MSVYLFDFVAAGETWRYTDSDTAETYGGQNYAPAALSVGELLNRAEDAAAGVQLTAPRDFAPVETWLASPPGARLLLTLRVLAADGTASAAWAGYVAGADWQDASVSLKCLGADSQLTRPALAVSYASTCRHAVYSAACGVAKEAHTYTGSIVAVVDGDPVIGMSSGYAAIPDYTAGVFEAAGMARTILRAQLHSPSQAPGETGMRLTLLAPARGLTVGTAATAARGCARDKATCRDVFENVVRFGGHPYIPLENPFNKASLA